MSRNRRSRRDKKNAKQSERTTLASPYQSELDTDDSCTSCDCCCEQKKPTKWFRSPEWWTGISSIVLAVFSIFSFRFLFIQLDESHKALLLDQRAWVGVQEGTWQDDNPYTKDYRVKFINSGKTPAFNVTVYTMHKAFLKDQFPDNPPYDPVQGPASKGALFPATTSYAIGSALPNDDGTAEMLESGKMLMYVYGTIEYTDAFSRNHWTHFCYQINTFPGLKPGMKTMMYQLGPKYNDTDDHPENQSKN